MLFLFFPSKICDPLVSVPYLLLRQVELIPPRKATEHCLLKCIWYCLLQHSTQCGYPLPSCWREELRLVTLEFISWFSILISFIAFNYSLWSVNLGDQQNYGSKNKRIISAFHLSCKKLVTLGPLFICVSGLCMWACSCMKYGGEWGRTWDEGWRKGIGSVFCPIFLWEKHS